MCVFCYFPYVQIMQMPTLGSYCCAVCYWIHTVIHPDFLCFDWHSGARAILYVQIYSYPILHCGPSNQILAPSSVARWILLNKGRKYVRHHPPVPSVIFIFRSTWQTMKLAPLGHRAISTSSALNSHTAQHGNSPEEESPNVVYLTEGAAGRISPDPLSTASISPREEPQMTSHPCSLYVQEQRIKSKTGL